MKIAADYYTLSGGVEGGVQSKHDLYKVIDPDFKTIGYKDACEGLNYPMVTIDSLRFREWEANQILQKYIQIAENTMPDMSLIVYNSICGGYMKHKTPTVSVLNDNYVAMSDRLYNGNYVDLNGYNMYRRMYLKLQLDSCKNADVVVSESETDAKCYEKYGVKSVVVENGVDDTFWKSLGDKEGLRIKYGIPVDKKVGIFVGSFSPIKGYHIFHDLVLEREDTHWIMVLKHGLDQNVKSENVSIACQVKPDMLRELYNCADFLVQPSIWESGHNLASLEGMSCGLPVLVSDVGGFSGCSEVEDFGVVVKKWDSFGFSTGLDNLLSCEIDARKALFNHGWDLESYKSRWKRVLTP